MVATKKYERYVIKLGNAYGMSNGGASLKLTLSFNEATMWADKEQARSLAEQFGGVLMGVSLEKV